MIWGIIKFVTDQKLIQEWSELNPQCILDGDVATGQLDDLIAEALALLASQGDDVRAAELASILDAFANQNHR